MNQYEPIIGLIDIGPFTGNHDFFARFYRDHSYQDQPHRGAHRNDALAPRLTWTYLYVEKTTI